jgi:hypothetical protein
VALRSRPGPPFSVDFATDAAVATYCEGRPLEAQLAQMGAAGIRMDASQLRAQLEALASLLRPTHDRLLGEVLGHSTIALDEAWWGDRGGEWRPHAWAWGVASARACWYGVEDSRRPAAVRRWFGDFSGTVLCEDWRCQELLAQAAAERRFAAGFGVVVREDRVPAPSTASFPLRPSWDYFRRMLLRDEPLFPEECDAALDLVDRLLSGEVALPDLATTDPRHRGAVLAVRRDRRARVSRPIVERLRSLAEAWRVGEGHGPPAWGYLLEHWDDLTAFVADPGVPIHDHDARRALRVLVRGRQRKRLGDVAEDPRIAAIFYSLVDAAGLCGVDGPAYLRRAARAAWATPSQVPLPGE